MTGPVTVGLAVSSHNPNELNITTFHDVSVTPSGGGPLPAPSASADVGAPSWLVAGYTGGVFTLNGAGNDIWAGSDQFQYVSQALSGDGTITARVTSQDNTDPWAKSGIMIKQSTTAGSPYALVAVTPGNGVHMEYNYYTDVAGGTYTFPNVAPVAASGEHRHHVPVERWRQLDEGRSSRRCHDRPGHCRPVRHLP